MFLLIKHTHTNQLINGVRLRFYIQFKSSIGIESY